jgi:hypothetical protein
MDEDRLSTRRTESAIVAPSPDLRSQVKPIVFTILGTGIFGFILWGISEFLSLRGVVNLAASRVILLLIWLASTLGACAVVARTTIKRRVLAVFLSSVILACSLLALDTWAPRPLPTSQPDVVLRFVYPQSISFEIENISDSSAGDARYYPVIWNLDSKSDNPIPVLSQTLRSFIKPHEAAGPYSLTASFDQPFIPLAKAGDRILGFITVTCLNCPRTRAYWIYAVQGNADSSWYAELPTGQYPNTTEIFRNLATIRKNPDALFVGVKQGDRKTPARSPEELQPTH